MVSLMVTRVVQDAPAVRRASPMLPSRHNESTGGATKRQGKGGAFGPKLDQIRGLLLHFRTGSRKLRSILADPFHSSLLCRQETPLCLVDHFLVILDVAHLFHHTCPKRIFRV